MEKRTNTRVLFNVNAVVKYQDKTLEGKVNNVSLYGILLQTPEQVPVDTAVDVKVCMEGTTTNLTLNLQGHITRSDQTGTAIAFDSIDIDSFVHLKNIVAYNEGDEDKIMKEFHDSLKCHQSV